MGIRLAKQAAVKELEKYVDAVAEALGRGGALVTDETHVFDLLEVGEKPHRETKYGVSQTRPGNPEAKKRNDHTVAHAIHLLGIPISRDEAVVVVARRLRNFTLGGKS